MVLSTRDFISTCFLQLKNALCHNYDDPQLSSQLDNLMEVQRSLFLAHIPFCIPVYRLRMIFNEIFLLVIPKPSLMSGSTQVGQQDLTLELGDDIR